MNYTGLSSKVAQDRLSLYGPNIIKDSKKLRDIEILLNQFKNPYIILLLSIATLSYFLGEKTDAIIIITIILFGSILDFYQERSAYRTVEKLLSMVKVHSTVIRDGKKLEIPVEEVVYEDIIVLSAGDMVPADAILLESKDLFINESLMTGEPYPVEKRGNDTIYMGTDVVSGFAIAKVVKTGKDTAYGKLVQRLKLGKEETDFEKGIRHFGFNLLEIATVLILIVFFINTYLNRGVIESLLFSLALGIGIAPVLLPAIVNVGLSYGAKHMAKKGAIVKRLLSIENLGSMNVLCCDKTGTLTIGHMKVSKCINLMDENDQNVALLSCLNASFQTGYQNPIDEAIKIICDEKMLKKFTKLDEIPYDFGRKRLSILVKQVDKIDNTIITKGAYKEVISICSFALINGRVVDISKVMESIDRIYSSYSKDGFKLIALAYRDTDKKLIDKDDEVNEIFLGFVVLEDPIREDVKDTIENLKKQGIDIKIITGDNKLVANYLAKELDLRGKVLNGDEIKNYTEDALISIVKDISVFSEVNPLQKERIVSALKKAGFSVGYLGDGINDIAAMRTADVAISVQNAVDIAKETADLVLTQYSLKMILDAVLEGRKTFANTLKYLFMQTSSNFGNVFSMAGVSVIIPFLPLLPKQVLAANLLTDTAVMSIPSDNVDKEWEEKPVRWDLNFIKKFMFVFGFISSLFDYITFFFLLFMINADSPTFRSAWFLESIFTQIAVLLVLRTKKVFFRSMPSILLVISITAISVFTVILPYTFIGNMLELKPLDPLIYLFVITITFLYIIFVEIAKTFFYKKIRNG